MASIEEINTTTTMTSSDLIDSSQNDYFRLYDASVDDNDINGGGGGGGGGGGNSISSFIVGIWNPLNISNNNNNNISNSYSYSNTNNNNNSSSNNQTNLTSMNPVSDVADAIVTGWTSTSMLASESTDMDADLTSTALSSNYDYDSTASFSASASSSSSAASSNDVTSFYVSSTDGEGHLFSTVAQMAAEYAVSSSSSNSSSNYVTGTAAGVGGVAAGGGGGSDDDVDIALIDSAETALGGDTDYDGAGFNGGGGTDDLIHQSIASSYDSISGLGRNETFHQRFDGGGSDKSGGSDGSTFMLLLEDFGEYFYNYNGSMVSGTTTISSSNLTEFNNYRTNCTNSSSAASCNDISEVHHNYWAMILMLFPIITLVGNILVIMSVCRERSLQTVTNYFIVSLAIADLLVAVVVMPFAVYALYNIGHWTLPNVFCDFYIAMDVICSSSSILNLVAISVDRYIAVTHPIYYSKHKSNTRLCLMIVLVWVISAAIGTPIILGLNNTPDRDPNLCVFYNTDFILYSSFLSFYIPCMVMVYLYWHIFKALRNRARKQRAARKPHLSELTGGSVIENIAQTRRLAETALDNSRHAVRIIPDEPATNTGSGSNEEEDENAISPDIDDCHVIVNDKSTEFMLATVVEETGNVVAQITTQPQLVVADPNGNHDSGYAPSNVDDVLTGAADSSPPDSPVASGTTLKRSSVGSRRDTMESSPKREPALSVAMKSFVRHGVQEAMTLARNDSTLSATSKASSRKDKKNSQASSGRFTIYKVHKASKKKREKSSAKKERKATKTLAIVLGVFLFCWAPFFSCNIMDALCAKYEVDCRPTLEVYIITTWLGYVNSFVNPIIYTIFNPEFRKAFKKIVHMV